MRYPVKFKKEANGNAINVSFPDIPEALTYGRNEKQATQHALEALESALDFYFESGEPIPLPSVANRSRRVIELPPSVAAKVLLHNEMLRQKIRPIDLARKMGIPRQEITRVLNFKHNTKIDTTAQALRALGKHLELHVA